MRRLSRALVHGAIAGLFAASSAVGQELQEICPGAEDGTGALWGAVTDSDADMVLPGANVVATWVDDGDERNAEVQVGLDGSYTMCYVPLGTEISVHATFATMEGAPVQVTLSEIFLQQDLSLSMTGSAGGASDDERIWLCLSGGESQINIQNSRIIRCDSSWKPLETCPKTELGQISAQAVGAGSGMIREMIETLVQEAKRVGANAVINPRFSRGSISGEAVLIEVDPSTC